MKDRCHDEAMAEMFKEDPAFAVELVNSILDDGDQDDLQIAFRQMDKAGLFDRAGVLYEVACDVIGAIIAHYSETLAQERGKPVPDAATVERIEATKRALRMERDELDASNAEAIKAVIRKYGPQARKLYAYECRRQSRIVAQSDLADKDLQDFMDAALADVDVGNVIDHQDVQAWVDKLSTDVPAMTVAELIEHLRRFPQDMPVLVQGYETGWDRIYALREAPVVLFKKAQKWDGEYKEANEFRHPGEPFSAVLIEGRRGAHR